MIPTILTADLTKKDKIKNDFVSSPSRLPNLSIRVVPPVRFQRRFVMRREVKAHLKKKQNNAFFQSYMYFWSSIGVRVTETCLTLGGKQFGLLEVSCINVFCVFQVVLAIFCEYIGG